MWRKRILSLTLSPLFSVLIKVEASFGNVSVEDTGTDFEEMKEGLIIKLNAELEEENSSRISEADDGYYLHLDKGG